MGPTWVLSAPGGSHVGPTNLATREGLIWCLQSEHHFHTGASDLRHDAMDAVPDWLHETSFVIVFLLPLNGVSALIDSFEVLTETCNTCLSKNFNEVWGFHPFCLMNLRNYLVYGFRAFYNWKFYIHIRLTNLIICFHPSRFELAWKQLLWNDQVVCVEYEQYKCHMPYWAIHVSTICDIIDLDNGFLPVCHQTII